MKKRACSQCGKVRWAKTDPSTKLVKTVKCKPCRK